MHSGSNDEWIPTNISFQNPTDAFNNISMIVPESWEYGEDSVGNTGFIDSNGYLVFKILEPREIEDASNPFRDVEFIAQYSDFTEQKTIGNYEVFSVRVGAPSSPDMDIWLYSYFIAHSDYIIELQFNVTGRKNEKFEATIETIITSIMFGVGEIK